MIISVTVSSSSAALISGWYTVILDLTSATYAMATKCTAMAVIIIAYIHLGVAPVIALTTGILKTAHVLLKSAIGFIYI